MRNDKATEYNIYMHSLEKIRNFAIIAHIDHGKSTLADRMLLHTKTVEERKFQDQLLDSMDLERERGITIKSHPVRMFYRPENQQTEYQLNLIDTPGHVDFSYEVSRSLAACEGVLLIIDAAQGVQAQTMANVNLAFRQNVPIIPVINKIDLPAADTENCLEQLEEILTIPATEAILTSAKEDIGITELLNAIVDRIPPPNDNPEGETQALIFDSIYNPYRGVINYIRLFNGSLKPGNRASLMSTGLVSEVKECGYFTPSMTEGRILHSGEVGYLITSIKDPAETRIGDTLTDADRPCAKPLPGFKPIQPMAFSGIYPVDARDYEKLKFSISKLQLNDSAFTFQPENSVALGAGFRCGFLGVLHMEIIQERLRREYELDIILTYPSVVYHVYLNNGELQKIDNPVHLPEPTMIDRIEEPIIRGKIITPNQYLGPVMNLILERRGECTETQTVDQRHVVLTAIMPLHEIIVQFYDRLKSITRGYASLDYEPAGYRADDLVRLDMLVNGEPVDAFSSIVHRDHAAARGRMIAEKLKDVIPPQMFQIALQAAIGSNIVARENIRALRKNVTAKCYGGDITRKRKLLEKQKEGKKKMKNIGNVEIPHEAFVAVLKAKNT